MKKILTGLSLLVASYGFSQSTPELNEKSTQEATGTVMASPELFDIKSFAHVQLYNGEDTINLYTGPTGTARYALNVNEEKTITAYIQPGTIQGQKGDQFKPYHSIIAIKPGKNDLQELYKTNHLSELKK